VKVRVCQLFEVCQREFANLSLPCEGRIKTVVVIFGKRVVLIVRKEQCYQRWWEDFGHVLGNELGMSQQNSFTDTDAFDFLLVHKVFISQTGVIKWCSDLKW